MQQKKYLDYNGLTYVISKLKNEVKSLDAYLNFITGVNKISTLKNIPSTKRLVYAEISTNDSLSINGNIEAGKYLHILVKNNSANQVTVSLPSAAPYFLTNTDVLIIPAQKIGEINAVSDGVNIFLRAS